MDIFGQIVEKIIEEQAMIIGPVALEQAKKVPGLEVDPVKHEVAFKGDKKEILEGLVNKYEHLFGRASIEVCREAVRNLIPKVPADQLPAVLH